MTNERSMVIHHPAKQHPARQHPARQHEAPQHPVQRPTSDHFGLPGGRVPVRVQSHRPSAPSGGPVHRPVAPHLPRPSASVLRRRRFTVMFGVGVLTLTGVGVASASAGRSGGPATTVHVVMPGESLWSIARDAKPHGDVRPLVAKLRRQLSAGTLQPGDELLVPAG